MRNVVSVRQKGMLAAIDLNFQPEWEEGIKRGVYLIVATNRIMLAPALNMNTKDLETGLQIITTYLAENL